MNTWNNVNAIAAFAAVERRLQLNEELEKLFNEDVNGDIFRTSTPSGRRAQYLVGELCAAYGLDYMDVLAYFARLTRP